MIFLFVYWIFAGGPLLRDFRSRWAAVDPPSRLQKILLAACKNAFSSSDDI